MSVIIAESRGSALEAKQKGPNQVKYNYESYTMS